jgi:hypothetical protein
MSEYGMVFRFVDQSEPYTLGFEAGIVYQRMRAAAIPIETTIHTKNAMQIQLMAAKMGYTVDLKALPDGWSTIVITKACCKAHGQEETTT